MLWSCTCHISCSTLDAPIPFAQIASKRVVTHPLEELEMQELRRERLEKEQEVDRLRVLLKAQEQRNAEQLVTVDKYHASVANYDAEMRQMHVLLECEREEVLGLEEGEEHSW
eukprot:5915861-Amphidinium_carterae.1